MRTRSSGQRMPDAASRSGNTILRCETAPLAALSIIMYETGNME